MRLIALMGKSKSGKDTLGSMLTEHDPRGTTIAFADKLKRVCADLYDIPLKHFYDEALKGKPTELRCLKCPACGSIKCEQVATSQVLCRGCTAVGEPKAFAAFWTPRMILQHVGTEGCRFVDDMVWVRHALLAANALLKDHAFVVITDCRFKSEMRALKKAGGQVWRIRRPETDRLSQGIAGHASETEMDAIPDSEFDLVINNDATLEVLRVRGIEALSRMLHLAPQ